jgi:hypothetical protein
MSIDETIRWKVKGKFYNGDIRWSPSEPFIKLASLKMGQLGFYDIRIKWTILMMKYPWENLGPESNQDFRTKS